jgi:hypothetical protein
MIVPVRAPTGRHPALVRGVYRARAISNEAGRLEALQTRWFFYE